jgi:hypothetical protein
MRRHQRELRERGLIGPKSQPVRRAHNAINNAIRDGKLLRPSVCENGCTGKLIEAAHIDYSQPFLVRWLCRPCHRKWDHAEPKGDHR